MKDMRVHLEKLRSDAADCAVVSNLATDKDKQELFSRLAEHLNVLAAEVERAIASRMEDDRA
jgi:predicted nuclease of restriction endonuclease-like RecB superfamily